MTSLEMRTLPDFSAPEVQTAPAVVDNGDTGTVPGELESVMKSFACGDVVPGCRAQWVCDTEDDVLAQVAQHARVEHGLAEVSDELVAAVRSNIVTV